MPTPTGRAARLPTEAEWEVAAETRADRGQLRRERPLSSPCARRGPRTRRSACQQMFGDVWEWTQSSYSPYPGFQIGTGRAGRIQRQIHVQPVRAARRLVRDTSIAHSTDLPQLLPAGRDAGSSVGCDWRRMHERSLPPRPVLESDGVARRGARAGCAARRRNCPASSSTTSTARSCSSRSPTWTSTTRPAAELRIMRASAARDGRAARARMCLLIEYGSGSSQKTRLLLDHLARARGLCADRHLARAAAGNPRRPLASAYPGLCVCCRSAPTTRGRCSCRRRPPRRKRRVAYYPGSTIGNFVPERGASASWRPGRASVRPATAACSSASTSRRIRSMLHRAYNDALGHHRGVQPQHPGAVEPRAGRRLRARPLPPLRLLQPGLRARRDAPGQPGRAGGAPGRRPESTSIAAKASGPRPRTSTARPNSPRSRRQPAGASTRSGPTTAACSASSI